MQATLNILGFALYPAMAIMIGGVLALWRPMKSSVISGLQHFAMGYYFVSSPSNCYLTYCTEKCRG